MKKLSPLQITLLLLAAGLVQLVAGIYLLAGLGWALVALSLPFLASAAVLIRGLTNGRPDPG